MILCNARDRGDLSVAAFRRRRTAHGRGRRQHQFSVCGPVPVRATAKENEKCAKWYDMAGVAGLIEVLEMQLWYEVLRAVQYGYSDGQDAFVCPQFRRLEPTPRDLLRSIHHQPFPALPQTHDQE